jgi:hypothetical protein
VQRGSGLKRTRSRVSLRLPGLRLLTTLSHTVEKLLLFAGRVTLGITVRCRIVADRRPRWRVGLIGTNDSVPPLRVMNRSRVRRGTQGGDQKAHGQKNRTHRFFSNRRRCACLGRAQAAPSQEIASSRFSHIGGITAPIARAISHLQRRTPAAGARSPVPPSLPAGAAPQPQASLARPQA